MNVRVAHERVIVATAIVATVATIDRIVQIIQHHLFSSIHVQLQQDQHHLPLVFVQEALDIPKHLADVSRSQAAVVVAENVVPAAVAHAEVQTSQTGLQGGLQSHFLRGEHLESFVSGCHGVVWGDVEHFVHAEVADVVESVGAAFGIGRALVECVGRDGRNGRGSNHRCFGGRLRCSGFRGSRRGGSGGAQNDVAFLLKFDEISNVPKVHEHNVDVQPVLSFGTLIKAQVSQIVTVQTFSIAQCWR